jgi:hypothetical protein
MENQSTFPDANELDRTGLSPRVGAAKNRVPKIVELHNRAEDLIEKEVSIYRKDLYDFAQAVARHEMGEDIITRSHVMKAKQLLWRRRTKYSFSDGVLTLGGVLLGTSITHIIALIQNPAAQPNLILITAGIAGGLLLGMGSIGKAKQN